MKLYPCPNCQSRHPADALDDHTGLCPKCRDPKPKYKGVRRGCVICGAPISGYSNRKTCTTRCRVALHRRNKREAI